MDSPLHTIILIGFRGAGKTTVGRLLAHRLSLPFVDTDQIVAQTVGASIVEIFANEGESGFRKRESDAISRASQFRPAVISIGGGAVTVDQNRTYFRPDDQFVWLTATAETLNRRIADDQASASTRPLLNQPQGVAGVKQLLQDRDPLYREWADVCISTEGRTPESIVGEIRDWLTGNKA